MMPRENYSAAAPAKEPAVNSCFLSLPSAVLRHKWAAALLAVLALALLAGSTAQAQSLPKISIGVEPLQNPKDLSVALQIVLLLTVLSLAPSILIMMTSFIRIVVVLSFLRQAIGTSQMPPNQIVIALALILTFFIMAPVANQAYDQGLKPYLDGKITQPEAFKNGMEPIRTFMLKQVREKDLALFVKLSGMQRPQNQEDIPNRVLIPGFVLSELRTSFQIAFVIFIPFLVIDMVVASVLMSMGMLMLPPVMVALPFKILLFVLVDGWYLIVKALVESFK
ncbi:MAG: flagellar type III secretion system pore protein FliP [candidate division Zixibacteria bacterium]|nr:flagellar type III secretion system pore protein FliP [candidate division Zixibacteria bacterium]